MRENEFTKTVFYFSSIQDGVSKQIQKAVEMLAFRHGLEIYRNVNGLKRRLLHKEGNKFLAVLLAANREELEKLVSLKSQLRDFSIILITPDEDEDTIKLGNMLNPDYVFNKNNKLRELSAVLMKMLQAQANHI